VKRRRFLNGLMSIPLAAGTEAVRSFGVTNLQPNHDEGRKKTAGDEKGQLAPVGGPITKGAHFPKVLVNHLGFRPEAGKYMVVNGVRGATSFDVVNMRQKGQKPSFTGQLAPGGTDLGSFLIGDFSGFKQPGIYRVSIPGEYPFWSGAGGKIPAWSHNFRIDSKVWDDPVKKLLNYFQVQSCGASKHGYNTPCHTGDIRRDDGGKAKPVTGGWHAADDCVRDVPEILHGLLGLTYFALTRPDLETELKLLKEIRWGNDYFHAVQSPEGYLYFGVYPENYYDVSKDWWDSQSYVLMTRPAELYLQHNFIAVQGLLAEHYRKADSDYADRCRQAGERCFAAIGTQRAKEVGVGKLSFELATGVLAGVHMFRATGKSEYLIYGREMANRLISLQTPDGFWIEGYNEPLPSKLGYDRLLPLAVYAPLVPLGLCVAARWLDKDQDHPRWIAALEKYALSCIKHFSAANSFGVMPYRIFAEPPIQKARSWNDKHYRYFIETNRQLEVPGSLTINWQTGNVASTSGYGVVMVYLAEILGLPCLRQLAQRQLDWVLGVNPFDASMIVGLGRNQPPTYPSLDMVPGLPDIAGAVFEGPIGDEEDDPVIIPAFYANVEYWMPHQAWVLWLMAELSADRPAGP